MNDMQNIKIWTGRHVELEVSYSDGEIERLSLDIVADASAEFEQGFLGESTPLARAIIGHTSGSVVAYQAGIVKILSVSQSISDPPLDAAKRRDEVIQKAVSDSDRTSVMLFASSFNGKWGDYDPKSLLDDEDNLNQDKNEPGQ